jgi:hypothetical protein
MNLFRIMQSIRGWAQAGKIDFPGAVKYLTDLGVEMDGIVHQALKNVFKEGKARDPDFGNVVEKLQIDEQGIPFNPNTLKSTTEKRGVENLFKDKSISEKMSDIKTTSSKLDDAMKEYENIYKPKSLADELAAGEGVETFETILPTKKVPKEVKFGKPDYERIARMEGIDVEEIRGKTVKEIIEYLAMLQKKDGGRIGFQIGGLSDQAQSIYDSWISAGHSEADTLAYLTSRGMYNAGGEEAEGIETVVNTTPGITQDGGGGGGYYPLGTMPETGAGSGLIGDFQRATFDRQKRLTNPNKIQNLINQTFGGGQRDIGAMIRSGQVDQSKIGGLPFAGNILSKMLPDKYYDMPLSDQVFTQSMMGYDGPTVFGENTMSNKDPFGINVRSGFGNYAEYVSKDLEKLNDAIEKATAKYEAQGWGAADIARQIKALTTRRDFRQKQTDIRSNLHDQIKAAAAEKKKKDDLAKITATTYTGPDVSAFDETIKTTGPTYGPHTPTHHGTVAHGPGGRFERANTRSSKSSGKDYGPWSKADGGLATMFTRRR